MMIAGNWVHLENLGGLGVVLICLHAGLEEQLRRNLACLGRVFIGVLHQEW